MGITHAAVKSSGDVGTAAEWNAEHTLSSDYQPKLTATRIIAASDSDNNEQADYVCDGTADEVQINLAINDLVGLGGRVILLEGTYTTSAAITLIDNITLEGQGKGTKIHTVNNIYMITSSSKSGLIIRNLYLLGPDLGGAAETGIHLFRCSGSKVENCWVEDFNITGISFFGTDDSKILNNFVDNCNSFGICVAAFIANGHNNIISGNHSTNNDKGIQVAAADRNIICSNQTRNNTTCGIEVSGAGADRNLVHGNISPDLINDTGTNTVEADNIEA